MANNPGDIVYKISAIHVDGMTARTTVDLRYGVVDKNNSIVWRVTGVVLMLDGTLDASLKAAVAAHIAANLPVTLAGAVPA